MASLSSLPCSLRPLTLHGNGGRCTLGSLSCQARSLSVSGRSGASSSSSFSLSTGAFAPVRLSAKSPQRRGGLVVCEAAPGKKPDQAAKRMRQNQKRRLRNKSRKSEIRSRTRRVFWELNALRKKKDATIEDVYRVEKMIAIIYSKIDKAVRVGVIHKNAASHRKSRLARRKKALLLFRGWYTPAAENPAPLSA